VQAVSGNAAAEDVVESANTRYGAGQYLAGCCHAFFTVWLMIN
jgi:hypothetical protein